MVSSVREHYGDIVDCLNHNLRMELYHILGDDSYSAELRSILAVRIHQDSRDLIWCSTIYEAHLAQQLSSEESRRYQLAQAWLWLESTLQHQH